MRGFANKKQARVKIRLACCLVPLRLDLHPPLYAHSRCSFSTRIQVVSALRQPGNVAGVNLLIYPDACRASKSDQHNAYIYSNYSACTSWANGDRCSDMLDPLWPRVGFTMRRSLRRSHRGQFVRRDFSGRFLNHEGHPITSLLEVMIPA